jgi:hypothetical protein
MDNKEVIYNTDSIIASIATVYSFLECCANLNLLKSRMPSGCINNMEVAKIGLVCRRTGGANDYIAVSGF